METLSEKRKVILEDVVSHFNSTNRCVTLNGSCKYAPIPNTSEGCAVGRLIKDKELCRLLDEEGKIVSNDKIFKRLPIEIQELGEDFLRGLQRLHDTGHNWNETGLSEIGLHELTEIKNKFDL